MAFSNISRKLAPDTIIARPLPRPAGPWHCETAIKQDWKPLKKDILDEEIDLIEDNDEFDKIDEKEKESKGDACFGLKIVKVGESRE